MSDFNVEAAPDSVDLDELLGLTDVDLVDESESAINEPVVEEEVIDEPHITISTKKLLDVLKISAMIAAAGENSFEGKVVVFKIEDDEVKLLLSDNKRNIEKSTEIVNTDNRFKGFLGFSTQFLARLIKLCGSSFSIIERTETKEDKSEVKSYYLKVTGGEVRMDNVKMSEDKFVKTFDDAVTQYNKDTITDAIKRLFTFASTSIKSGKNIDFSDNIIQATPINSLAKIVSGEKYPSFKLSLTDCRILHTLLLTESDETFGINKDGKVFTGSTFKFKTESFPTSKCAFDAVAERMFNGECAVVDAGHLTKIAELSVGLDTSIGTLKFNYNDEGRVECELLTKRGNSNLIIQGTTNTDLVPMEKPVEIPAVNLKGALSVFPQETTLNMHISSDGVALDTANTIKVSVLGKGIGK